MTEKVPEIEMNAVVQHVLAIVVVATVSLSLPARAAAQAAFATTTSLLSFGNVPVGETTPTLFVAIQNIGNLPGSMSYALQQNAGGGFAIEPPLLPISVAPGGSVLFGVTFTPQAAGPHLAQLR